MVESVRRAVGPYYGPSYEIVLVDGNSVDGTQDWIEAQPDTRLIRHASLLGAVKAFNDGAFAAVGQYVIMANDDIEFLADGILKAWLFMQDHPDCGIGCFYQDRGGRDWHVDRMMVVRDNTQSYDYYGQVCIVPKWLGDSVGWWGDYLHTYAGDNELSSRSWQLGYKVLPIEGAKIHDNEAKDDLRKINNIDGGHDPKAVRGHHPDSWNWGTKWRKNARDITGRHDIAGAVVPDGPQVPNPLQKRERVLYLPIYEQGWEIQKSQKWGLRAALAEKGLVAEVDYVTRNAEVGKEILIAEIMNLCHKLNPTLVLTQLHGSDILGPHEIARIRGAAPQAKFVNWNGDYYPQNLLSTDGVALARAFDIQATVNRSVLEQYQQMGVSAIYWQIGWEPDGRGQQATTAHDVVFLGNGYSAERQKFVHWLRGLNGFDLGVYGQGWPTNWAQGECLYDFKTGCGLYRGAKISLGDSQWPESGFVSNRVMQALAAGGAALAHQWFRGMEHLGLIDGETVIIWRTFEELEKKIRYYLNHEDERRRIAEAGEALAVERHSFQARVNELMNIIGREADVMEAGWRW
jgi:glycosyltransferase involved in cell wall biosynthesis